MILIIASQIDFHTLKVLDRLREMREPAIQFDLAAFPTQARISFHYNDGGQQLDLYVNDKWISLSEITAVWWRRVEAVVPDARLSQEDQEFVRGESQHALNSLWALLSDRFWINPVSNDRAAHGKPYQLAVAASVGLQVPRTLITNDPREVRAFFDRCEGRMIYKAFSGYVRSVERTGYGIYTTPVTAASLDARLNEVCCAPCTFQEHLSKAVELRVTVMGDQIFAVEMDTQGDERGRNDWRRSIRKETDTFPHRVIQLEPDLESKIRTLMKRLGLVLGCLDFVVTPDNRIVFLEINPSGQWYWLEQETGLPLTDTICSLLMQKDARSASSDFPDRLVYTC